MMACFRKLIVRSGFYSALGLLAVLAIFGPVRAQSGGPVPSIDRVNLPSTFEAGQPFDVEVWATNQGDTANGGSITLSLPDGYAMSIVEADTPLSTPDEALCDQNFDHTWLLSPGGACSTVLMNNTACRDRAAIHYPMAESWYVTWPSGVAHHLTVRIFPDRDTRQVTVYLRVAMRAWGGTCDLRTAPGTGEAEAYDQQGFPVLSRSAAAQFSVILTSSPTPTLPPTFTPLPTRTPFLTETSLPTHAPSPTGTLLPTIMPSPSPTLTPVPSPAPMGGLLP